jgi:hypothetical protein
MKKLALLFAILFATTSFAQEIAELTVYRYKAGYQPHTKPDIYVDDVSIAHLENGHYFVAKLPVGKHIIRSTDPQSGIAIDAEPGKDYFVRVELNWGLPLKRAFQVILVPPEQGKYEVEKSKLSSPKDMLDAKVISPSPAPPPTKQDKR